MAEGQTLEERIERMEFEHLSLREEMRAGFARMATREDLRALGDELRAEMRKLHGESIAATIELREYIETASVQQAADTRRHFDVVADGLRDDVERIADAQGATGARVVANGEKLDATNQRIDRLELRVDAGFADMKRELGDMKGELGDVKGELGDVKRDLGGMKREFSSVRRDIAALAHGSGRGRRKKT